MGRRVFTAILPGVSLPPYLSTISTAAVVSSISLILIVVILIVRIVTRGVRIMLEKVADSARKAVQLAELYKPYGVGLDGLC